ncbi:MAG: hypothetical protein K1X88_14650 [Nannocystaceae bacterium]|nr:hypothetical protein [Nannocystaceae bacterium]
MSYDVSLRPRPGAAAPSIAELDAYFAGRPHTQASEGSARYANEDTEVGFGWCYDERQRSYDDSGPIALTARTSGNDTRALELVGEVEAVVRAFDLLVDDPTMNGMGQGELDREALLRGCLFASRFGLCVDVATGSLAPAEVPLYDDERHVAHWRWNLGRAALQREATDAVFVPRVDYMRHGDEVLASVAWVGQGPILLPEVDVITTIDTRDGGADLVVLRVAELAAALAAMPRRDAPLPHRFVEPSDPLVAALAAATPLQPRPTQLSHDSVLGRRYAEEVAAQYYEWTSREHRIAFGPASARGG